VNHEQQTCKDNSGKAANSKQSQSWILLDVISSNRFQASVERKLLLFNSVEKIEGDAITDACELL
jgi:hypothetical protein